MVCSPAASYLIGAPATASAISSARSFGSAIVLNRIAHVRQLVTDDRNHVVTG
jgi:hypothetical protein